MKPELMKLVWDDCKKSCTDIAALEVLRNQTILITGGTGFLGKWLAEMIAYLNEAHNFSIKLYLLGRDAKRFTQEVPHLAEKTFINLLEQDVRNLHDIPTNVQWVIHAAGSPDSKEHVSQPLRTIETIYKGTQSILDVCFRLPDLQKLLHISSHTVYGNTDALTLIPETAMGALACNSVNSAYPEAKRMAETLCAIYRNQQRLPITVVRPFAFVGPYHGLDKPWAINNFIRDGLLGGPIRILGNGKTVRSYLYGSDAAYWLVVLLAKGKEGQTYNMGSSEGINLNALAEKIAGIIGNNTHILTKSAKENYTNFSSAVPDTTKVLQQFGLSEKFQLEEALIRTIGWNQLKK